MRHIKKYLWLCFSTAMIATAAHASDPNDIFAHSRALRRQFMAQQLSAVSEQSPQQKEASLAKLIDQVLSLQPPLVRDPNQAAASVRTTEGQGRVAVDSATASVTERTKTVDNQPVDTTSQARQRALDDILGDTDDPESAPYPMELADVLYRAGKLDLAARYYGIALQRTSKEDATSYSWLLYQMANCLRHTDPTQANIHYDQLVRAYPGSVWAAAAQARMRVLTWLETNELKVHGDIATESDYE